MSSNHIQSGSNATMHYIYSAAKYG